MNHIKEYFHWLFVIAPLLSLVIARFGGIEERVAEFILIPAAIVINFLIIWYRSTLDPPNEQNLIRSFLTDDLLPNKFGRPLVFDAKIIIVEDEANQGAFIKSLKRQFKSKIESEEHNLILIPFTCHTSDEDNQKKKLTSKLEGANAVVVVRTSELECKLWVYETINDWAYERSDVPILFTKLDKPEQDEADQISDETAESDPRRLIPDKYFSIPSDPKSLPWRLLQRANERGFAWRSVASFNRLIATNCLILLVMSFLIGHFMISRQEQGKNRVLKVIFGRMAEQTKEQYKQVASATDGNKEMPTLNDNEYHVSYWFRYKGEVQQLVTTDKARSTHKQFNFSKKSTIGSAFVLGNHVTEWNNTIGKLNDRYPIKIRNIKDEEKADPEAAFYEEPDRDMTSIVCSSFNSTSDLNPAYTVGICVFTERKDKSSSDSYLYFLRKENRDFLRKEARELFERAKPLIEQGELIPLID